jgi:hypothetical protein
LQLQELLKVGGEEQTDKHVGPWAPLTAPDVELEVRLGASPFFVMCFELWICCQDVRTGSKFGTW